MEHPLHNRDVSSTLGGFSFVAWGKRRFPRPETPFGLESVRVLWEGVPMEKTAVVRQPRVFFWFPLELGLSPAHANHA